ncbi:MAG: hypothetical protein HQK89_04335 [Nitrospirae bacterium]|nr:hypothetical protein [Nitrospirota bacterium]
MRTLRVYMESRWHRSKFEVVDTVITQRGARTMAIDLKTHNVYLPTAQFSPAPYAVARWKKTASRAD